ncbi:MAG: helix-turn-helix domain-containing protein [Enterocloster bolteae]
MFFLKAVLESIHPAADHSQAEECLTQLKRLITCNDDTAKQDYGYDLKVKFLLGEFLIFINNLYRKYHNISSDTITSSYSLIYSVINHIHTHLSDELSLELLSSTFYINKFYLCNLFKNVTGTSPNQYIISCRIMKAKELLSQNLPVDSVCSLVGYKNLSHFSRIFKQHTGLSPKQYSKFKQAEDFKRK